MIRPFHFSNLPFVLMSCSLPEKDFLKMASEIHKIHQLAMVKHIKQNLDNRIKEERSLNSDEPKNIAKKERQKPKPSKYEHKAQEKQNKKEIEEIKGPNIEELTTKLDAITEDNQKYIKFLKKKKIELENKKIEHERFVQAETRYTNNLKKYNESKLERSRLLFQAILNSSAQNSE